MTDTPPDWVLIEAAKQSNNDELDISQLRYIYERYAYAFRALCDMIQKYEQPPVDRKVLCAEAAVEELRYTLEPSHVAIRAIELWEEGFGRD